MAVGVHRVHDGVCKHAQAHAHGKGDNGGDAHRVLSDAARVAAVAQGHCGRDCGYDGDGERGYEARGQVIERLRLAVDAVEHRGLLVSEAGGVLQPAHAQPGVNQVDERKHAGAQGDGYTYAQQGAEHFAAALRRVGAALAGGVAAALVDKHVGQRDQAAHRDAEDGSGGSRRQTVSGGGEVPGEGQARYDLGQHFEHLADSGRGHVLMPLAVAAVGAGQADQQHGRREDKDAPGGLNVVERVGELAREEGHGQGARHAEDEEGPPGH